MNLYPVGRHHDASGSYVAVIWLQSEESLETEMNPAFCFFAGLFFFRMGKVKVRRHWGHKGERVG